MLLVLEFEACLLLAGEISTNLMKKRLRKEGEKGEIMGLKWD